MFLVPKHWLMQFLFVFRVHGHHWTQNTFVFWTHGHRWMQNTFVFRAPKRNWMQNTFVFRAHGHWLMQNPFQPLLVLLQMRWIKHSRCRSLFSDNWSIAFQLWSFVTAWFSYAFHLSNLALSFKPSKFQSEALNYHSITSLTLVNKLIT